MLPQEWMKLLPPFSSVRGNGASNSSHGTAPEAARAMGTDLCGVEGSTHKSSLQDYGPKVNFRKQKLKIADFTGLPSFSQETVRRMGLYPGLEDFRPVEQCNLDYCPERGSAIDPHLDDSWLWGERLVSLNLLSSTVLSMSREASGCLLLCSAPSGSAEALVGGVMAFSRSVLCREVEVAIPVPRRSLLVLTGAARHEWQHAIHRRHIAARRVCATFRELSAEFSSGGRQQELGQQLLQIALSFQGRPV
nr:alpha-ketoglutarate-dependent dioxygenase alkB homolog 4 isoform X2 [Dasypus novemcinctus]